MRPDDAESGRPDDGAPAGRGPGGRLLVPLVVAGSAALVLSAALEGPARLSPPRLGGSGGALPAPAPELTQAPPRSLSTPPPISTDAVVRTILAVLVGLVALAVAVALIRLLVVALRRRRSRLHGPVRIEADVEPRTADAPAVLRGIAAALAAFEEDRESGDAVVRAWLGLQQAAEDAGLARSAAQTPTEFTGRVLMRRGTDRPALQTLLHLYLRARFDDGAITRREADDARSALRALETSWAQVPPAERA